MHKTYVAVKPYPDNPDAINLVNVEDPSDYIFADPESFESGEIVAEETIVLENRPYVDDTGVGSAPFAYKNTKKDYDIDEAFSVWRGAPLNAGYAYAQVEHAYETIKLRECWHAAINWYRGKSYKGPTWENNELQFARFIAETDAAGFITEELVSTLCEELDLKVGAIVELLDRAQSVYDAAKAALYKATENIPGDS